MEEKEVRQRLHWVSEFVGIGFNVEGKIDYIDEHGNEIPIKNTDIDLFTMVDLVQQIFIKWLWIFTIRVITVPRP